MLYEVITAPLGIRKTRLLRTRRRRHSPSSTGYKHTVARTESGIVFATGSNLSGQCNTSKWTDIVAVAAGA